MFKSLKLSIIFCLPLFCFGIGSIFYERGRRSIFSPVLLIHMSVWNLEWFSFSLDLSRSSRIQTQAFVRGEINKYY